jgi:ligand-binding sensor domain-containing protein
MKFSCHIIYVLFFSAITICGISQTLPNKNITINDGLPSNTIRCIYKDSRGLLWIGTDAGLCCYDGLTYKIFNESNGLKHDRVWAIVEDEQNNLWLSLYGKGLAKYDGKAFTYFDDKNGLVNNSIRRLHYSQKHKCLIIGTEQGVSLFDGKKIKSFKKEFKDFKFQITGINELQNIFLITSSRQGVYELKIIGTDIQNAKLDSLFYSKVTYSSYVDNGIYYGGDAEHNLIIRKLMSNKQELISCPIIWDYAKGNDNNLYFATCNVTSPEGGLFKYHNNELTDITKQANINSKALWCLFYDNETQQLWVGTEDKGLYKIDLSNQIQFLNSSFFGLKELQIQELYNDESNTTWIGAKDFIIKLYPDLSFKIIDKSMLWNKLKLYLKQKGLNPNSDTVFGQYKIKDGFSSFNITNDKEHNIWVATTWGLFCFDNQLAIKTFYASDGGHVSFNDKDQLFFGHMYSDLHFMPNKNDVKTTINFSVKNKNIPRDISKIIKNGNQLWYASITKGLYMSRDTNFYWLNANGCFKENNIKDLIIDSKHNLVIGTNSGKVYITKPKSDSIESLNIYNPNKELYGTSISFIDESNGLYFIGTNKGINIVKNNQFIKLINQSEGLSDLQFNDCVKDKKGNLWIATNNGLIQLNANKIASNLTSTNNCININAIKVNGENYLPFDTLISWNSFNNKQIKLNHNQNELEISFSNSNPYNADKNIYRYKIVGLSDNWSDYESVGKIQLRAIANGNYQILIEGKNIGTGEIFKTKTLELIITPPFWKATWFILLSIILIVVLLYWVYKIRIQSVKQKAELTNKLLETRLEALRAQMNPHFTFNAINSIQNFIIDNDTTQALHYLGEFSKLIRQTLENATEKLTPLTTEINFLTSYITVQKMRFDTIKTSLTVDSDIDKYKTQIPPLIVQPFIENAFEHAFEKNNILENKIEINFKLKDQLLICIIKDNGKGFNIGDSHSLHQSKGHQLTFDRLNLLNKEYNTVNFKFEIINLTSMSSIQTGTQVTITFPLITLYS